MSFTGSDQLCESPVAEHADDKHTPLYCPHHKRMASNGGGRAWSDEEEAYLIETRLHKMPYKHIAAHLQKTELACRLHYHQLSFGTKRRRRTSSISSSRSSSFSAATYDPTAGLARPPPALSPPASPENWSTGQGQPPLSQNPIPILPKPRASLRRGMDPNGSLRLITQDIERFEERSRINKERLSRLYEAHRSHFWSMIARDYGENASPAVLEDVWRRSYVSAASDFPPTPPTRSPQETTAMPPTTLASGFGNLVGSSSSGSNGFSPINVQRSAHSTPTVPTRSSFAIASLLTEDKEVRIRGDKWTEVAC